MVYYIGFALIDAKNPARESIIITDKIRAKMAMIEIATNCLFIR